MNKYKFEKGFNIKSFLIAFSAVLLVGYGLWNARHIIIGPTIEIFSPTQDVETRENVLTVNGRAKNAAFISLNEKPISVDTEGLFEQRLLLSPGSNNIEIKVRDRFQQEVKKTITVYYKSTTTQLYLSNDTNSPYN